MKDQNTVEYQFQDVVDRVKYETGIVAKAEGKAEGKAETLKNVAMNLLQNSAPMELIIKSTGLSAAEIEKLSRTHLRF